MMMSIFILNGMKILLVNGMGQSVRMKKSLFNIHGIHVEITLSELKPMILMDIIVLGKKRKLRFDIFTANKQKYYMI